MCFGVWGNIAHILLCSGTIWKETEQHWRDTSRWHSVLNKENVLRNHVLLLLSLIMILICLTECYIILLNCSELQVISLKRKFTNR